MSGWFELLPPGLADRCKAYAQTFSIEDEQKENLPDRKGVMERVRITREGDSVVRTEVRTMMLTRIIVDAKPMGAVLIVLEIAKRRTAPTRLVALSGTKAGEYTHGAIEAAWGGLELGMGGGGGSFTALRFAGEPRKLHVKQVIELAESAL